MPIAQIQITILPDLDFDCYPLTVFLPLHLPSNMLFSRQHPDCPSRTSQIMPFFCSQLYNDSHMTQNKILYNGPQHPT